jgi:hypothetical protein
MGRIVGENKHKGTLYPVDSKAIYRIIYEVVSVLPTENIKTSVIYCVPIIGKVNEYDMYLYINGWSKIGSGSIDLSDYYTKEEVDDIVADISTLSFKIVQEKPIEDIETNIIYLIPKSGSTAGNIYEEWIYIDNKWELLGTTDIDLSNKMDLAPLNPTYEQIAQMPFGQIFDDTTAKTVTIKGGTELLGVIRSSIDPEHGVRIGSLGQLLYYGQSFYICNGNKWILLPFADSNVIRARRTTTSSSGKYIITSSASLQEVWDLFDKYHFVKVAITNQYNQEIGVTCLITRVTGNNHEHLSAVMLPTGAGSSYPIDERVHFLEQHAEGSSDTLMLETKYVYPSYEEYYTKTEIDNMIGDIGTALDTLNNNLAEV